jgi:hypothetical protein
MEETLKPMALEKFAAITEIFHQFAKAQAARLDAMANGLGIFAKEEDAYQQLREDLTAEVESVQFHSRRSNISSTALQLQPPPHHAGRPDAAPRRAPQGAAQGFPRSLRQSRAG